ncbi:hypothetical protein BC828DRAFT_377407 [Blastocladiella britannica]|nr:hypothetical protein BC828DRAFT_377407 [Blastocladiella britannica]
MKWNPDAELLCFSERQSNDETMRDFSQRLAVMEATARAKSTFLANMSHEIRTPASQVIQAAHMLAETNLSDEQQDHASVILKSGEQLLAILNDILDFSKLEDGKIRFENRTFDLHEAVRLSVDSFPLPAKPIDVGYYIGPGVPRFVVGDVVRLRQVFNNLLSNAIKFTDSGHVFIRAEVYREDTVGKTHLRFAVNDTGCGVPHERIAKIFERFEQSDDSITRIYGGTGLGLNICQSLCSLMGSRLHVSSVVGEGSQFSFQATFPTPEVGATDDSSVIASRSVRPMMSPPPNMLIVILASTPGRRGVEQDMFVFTQLLAPVGTATKTTCVSFSAWLDEEAISASSAAAVVLVSPQWPSLDQIQRLTKPTVLVCSDTLPVPSFRTQLQRAFLLSRPFKHSTFLRAVNSALRAGSAARSPVFPSVAISEDPVPMSPSHLHDLRPSLSLSLHSDPAILSQQPLRIGSTRLSESSTMHPPDSLASMSQTRPDASSARQQSLHVLVVDDNPVNRRMMQAMVAKLGHRVSLANNGREAVNVVKAASASDGVDPFDVVFMDIRMPIMDGLEATRLIVDHFVGKGPDGQTAASKSNHGRKPRRPIILGLSADALEEQERNGLESGMDRYLRKPLLRNDIAVALEQFFPHIVPAAVAAHHAHPAPMPPPAHSDRG